MAALVLWYDVERVEDAEEFSQQSISASLSAWSMIWEKNSNCQYVDVGNKLQSL